MMIGKSELFLPSYLTPSRTRSIFPTFLTGVRCAAEIASKRDPLNLMQVMLPQGVTHESIFPSCRLSFRNLLRRGKLL